ncbi:MAG TPA: hypothetical protein DCR14_00255, partial [Acidimicrobiaceae bacterium]|nr:hypothetical protein [Acidimicrobiaceae bacterium]
MNIRSFDPSSSNVVTAPHGARAHRDHVAHGDVIRHEWYRVRQGVWCLVGNGLSNQTFVEGPQGIIAIDTGESREEMREALRQLRNETETPVVAVIYTHFHYVEGTEEIFAEAGRALPVYGHERIVPNRRRIADEIGPAYSRGLVEQFGVSLPEEGPDALVNVGLGWSFRNPAHAPFTRGFVAPDHTFTTTAVLQIAGLTVEVTPAPSDADDSVTLWFPDLSVCVHNIVWPVLFNIFAIRGEEYRDARLLLRGIDHLIGLGAEHLVGTHGPPISGADDVRRRATRSRDAIAFLWDQTVRGINKGWSTDRLAAEVRLPDLYDDDHLTSERYGVAEHHVRQIHNGRRGWFDGDPAKLFPLPPVERAERLIAGFGGREQVAAQADAAFDGDDLRWAAELATWLVTADGDQADRNRLATVLRAIGQRSPAANIRNWCITRARDLEGTAPLDRHRQHRFRRADVEADPLRSVATLRVMLDPGRAATADVHLRLIVAGHGVAGLHLRNGVAVPTDGGTASLELTVDAAGWAALVTAGATCARLVDDGHASVVGGT